MKLMLPLLVLAFIGFCLYTIVTQRQSTLEEFIQVHNCAPMPLKTDPMGRKYREYFCADGIGHLGPFYEAR
jgi:hypothetical protein